MQQRQFFIIMHVVFSSYQLKQKAIDAPILFSQTKLLAKKY